MKKSAKKWLSRATIILALLLVLPTTTYAGFFSFMSNEVNSPAYASYDSSEANSQNLILLEAVLSVNPNQNPNRAEATVVSGTALYSETGPSGTMADISDIAPTTQISTYIVRTGDTLSEIASMFNVSVNTILWANEGLTTKNLQVGQTLIILPVSGIRHKVNKGDTLSSIITKYKVRIDDVLEYNDLNSQSVLAVGETIIIPDAELPYIPTAKPQLTAALHGASGPSYPGYYKRPLVGGVRTQGLHGYNAVDIAAPVGTPVYAAAAGTVIISLNGLWNQGYGNYVVVAHQNGTQTLYAHASKLLVSVGQKVNQGDTLALVGSTGKSTGPHLHFEIRGAKNPF
jgi:LysM repeat protein